MSYSQLVISDSPLGYWQLDSWNSLNANLLSSSTATYATQYNASFSRIKPIVSAAQNSTKLGSTSSIVVPNNYSIFTQGNERIPATVELWFNITNTSSQKYSIFRPMNSSNGSAIFECYVKNDKLWIESGANKQYISALNWENQQYLNISYLNGNITMSLNNADFTSIPTSSFSYDCNQFVIGPGNSDGPLFVNSLAIYKYAMQSRQMASRMNWATRSGATTLLMMQDGMSLFNTSEFPNTTYRAELLTDEFYKTSSNRNIVYKDNRIFLKKLNPITVSASTADTLPSYTLSASGIKFDGNRSSYIDLYEFIDFIPQTNGTIRMQVYASTTNTGNIILLSGFKNYKYLLGKMINSGGPKFKLSLVDQYDNEYQSIVSPSMTDGWHGVAINLLTSSITVSIDNASISNTINRSTIGGGINSLILGGYPSLSTNTANSIYNRNFVNGINGWSASGTAATVIENASYSYDGYYSIKTTASNTGDRIIYYYNNGSTASPSTYMIPVTASNNYVAYAYVYSNITASNSARIMYYDSNLTQLGSITAGSTVISSSAGWSYVEVSGSAPASAAYAVPYYSSSNISSTGSVYWSTPGFNRSLSGSDAYGYNNYIRNFAIDPFTASIVDFTDRGYFMIKFNNNLNISQKGVISGLVPDKTSAGGVLDTYSTYANPSTLSTIEYGKQGSTSITWSNLPTNYPLVGYEYSSVTFDRIKITLATDDAYNDIPAMDYFDLKYSTASSYSTGNGWYYVESDIFGTASLSDMVFNDVITDNFSKPNNIGIRIIPNITGAAKIYANPSSSMNGIRRFDALFKVNSLPSGANMATIFSQQGSNSLYINSSGSLIFNGTASVYVDNASVGGTISAGDIYYLSVLFSSSVSYLHLGSSSAGTNFLDGSFDSIGISPYTSSYSSQVDYYNRIWSNLFDYESNVMGNNLLPVQIASAENYNELSASWGFLGSSCTLARSSASSAHGTYSILATSSFPTASIRISTAASSSNFVPVLPLRYYAATAKIASSSARNATLRIIWYSQQSLSSSISISSSNPIATSPSWSNIIFTASAPINATYAAVELKIDSASSSDLHYIDEFGIMASSARNWTLPQSNNLDLNDGNVQSASDVARNYFSSDGSYFEMYALPKVKIITKKAPNTSI